MEQAKDNISYTTSAPNIVRGLVVGTRKAGTTWLYENFASNPDFVVSDKVKESSFFTGETGLTTQDYRALFPRDADGYHLEVDTSVCYASGAAEAIEAYNKDMNLVLILRAPEAFLKSRYVHSFRKGELKQDNPLEALRETQWLRDELDYNAIVKRFDKFAQRGQLTVLPYELLVADPHAFYDRVIAGLGAPSGTFRPSTTRVNVARESSLPLVSALLSKAAIFARGIGAHRLVNAAKSLGLHSALEKPINDKPSTQTPVDNPEESDALKDALKTHCSGAIALHQSLLKEAGLPL